MNSSLSEGGRIVLQRKKMMSKVAQIKEERAQIWITSMKMELSWKPYNQHKKLLKKQTQENCSHDKGEISGCKAKRYSIRQKSI